jgi:glycosyltransferase involved in cell wall biosynthesis
MAQYHDCTFVYHNGWGLPLLHDLDGASRRLVFLHGSPAYHEPDLPAFAGLIDGAIGVTPSLLPTWQKVWSHIGAERSLAVGAPVVPLVAEGQIVRAVRPPIVIGYAGRLEKVHKRVDRLPVLIRELKTRGLDFRFEVLGEGSQRAALARRLGDQVLFHGWTPKENYWRVLLRWDAMVFFSEVEGGPIALFEGAAVGTIPFYPAIGGSWGDTYAPQIDPICHYAPGDMRALAAAIETIFSRPSADVEQLRARASGLVANHTVENYSREIVRFIARVQALPKISSGAKRRNRASDLLPLGLVTRALPSALLKA